MDVSCKLTVCYEEPFWIGVYELIEKDKFKAAKIVFGSEPKDYEVLEAFLKNRDALKFSPLIEFKQKEKQKFNQKRMQREISRQLTKRGAGTKAQIALKMQHEQNKLQRKTYKCLKTEEEKSRRYELSRQKKKEKQRGR